MRINLLIPSDLVDYVNSQRGSMSVQSYLLKQLYKQKETIPNYEGNNDQTKYEKQ